MIGSESNFWLHSSLTGFDLTHPSSQDSALTYPRVLLETTTAQVTIDPAKSALVIVDMQNFFLSPCLGRSRNGNGIKACDNLLKHAIPACRKAGIRVMWLNWGLTEEDMESMPPATLRAFGFETVPHDQDLGDGKGQETAKNGSGINTSNGEVKKLPPKALFGKDPRLYRGIGSDIGRVDLEDGSATQAGRLLMRGSWNAELYPPLEEVRQQGLRDEIKRKDALIYKNRMSGFWGAESPCTKYLDEQGIRTLLFAGVNTDQCVGGSMQDAFTRGYDCILLSNGSGTSSPAYSQECIEYNVAKVMGFVLSCEKLAKGVENMQLL